MSHHLYHTQGLIIAQYSRGEANILYSIFSPELGLVSALAQGARHSRSKLRPHLRELSHARLTLVRGRELWRITAAQETGLLDATLACPETRQTWARVAGLIRRLIRGEDCQPLLYDDLLAGLIALGRSKNQADVFEQLLVLRLLAHLGYVAPSRVNGPWLGADIWQSASVPEPEARRDLLDLINHGLAYSQL